MVLQQVGYQSRQGRSIPADMDQALTEIVALRHVIAHRGSRVDAKALGEAPRSYIEMAISFG
jgi:hypothetical protein